jgi:cell division protein FtsA
VARELARAGFQDAATAGVVVTGGTSIMQGVPELAEGIFDQPVRRGDPIGVGGLADVIQSPIYSTAVGLALYGSHSRAPGESGAAANATPMGRLTRLVTRFLGDLF